MYSSIRMGRKITESINLETVFYVHFTFALSSNLFNYFLRRYYADVTRNQNWVLRLKKRSVCAKENNCFWGNAWRGMWHLFGLDERYVQLDQRRQWHLEKMAPAAGIPHGQYVCWSYLRRHPGIRVCVWPSFRTSKLFMVVVSFHLWVSGQVSTAQIVGFANPSC